MTSSTGFSALESTIRAQSKTTKQLGDAIELVALYYFTHAPKYKGVFRHIWLWNDCPHVSGADLGIDLVAEDSDGKFWAIQSKGYSTDTQITKADINSFMSASDQPLFHGRIIFATNDRLGSNAEKTLSQSARPCTLELRQQIEQADMAWPETSAELKKTPKIEKKKPRAHQRTAIRKVLKGFKSQSRGKLIMACGTGKTLVSLWIHEALGSNRTLVMMPSISLISNFMDDWKANGKDFDYLIICSDDTTDPDDTSVSELGPRVTTDVEVVRTFLTHRSSVPRVVFSTYQSSDVLSRVYGGKCSPFDLAIVDEAHRTVGQEQSLFTTIVHPTKIKAHKRLFMTATPRRFSDKVKSHAKENFDLELITMDNKNQYGEVFHELNFGEAIKKKLLSDYQVVIIDAESPEAQRLAEKGTLVSDKELLTDARSLATNSALDKAIKKYKLKKLLSFHNSVTKAKEFVNPEHAGSFANMTTHKLWAAHINGGTKARDRTNILKTFAQQKTVALVSNCACLNEGVNVPSIDSVVFIDPKGSEVDIIQAVGRAIRKKDDDKLGTIVLPVFVNKGVDPDKAVDASAYRAIGAVVRALRAHDSTLAEELDNARFELGKQRAPSKIALPKKIHIDIHGIELDGFKNAFVPRLLILTTNYTVEMGDKFAREKFGGRCLRKEGKKFIWKCKEATHQEWRTMPNDVLNRLHWCKPCAGLTTGTLAGLRKIAKDHGGKCLSKEYVNVHTKYLWQCKEGHQWEAQGGSVKSGTWCPYCGGRMATLAGLQKIAKDHGGKCLSKEYTRGTTEYLWECKEGHQWEATANSVKGGSWCARCAVTARLKDLQAIAKDRDGKCLSKEYVNLHTRYLWECKEGHQWESRGKNVKDGYWCKRCAVKEVWRKRKSALKIKT